jgi:hypothetical protein
VSKESAARAKPVPAPAPPPLPPDDEDTIAVFVPPPPKVVDLDEARPVVPSSQFSGYADRVAPRARRRTNKPGRRPGT